MGVGALHGEVATCFKRLDYLNWRPEAGIGWSSPRLQSLVFRIRCVKLREGSGRQTKKAQSR